MCYFLQLIQDGEETYTPHTLMSQNASRRDPTQVLDGGDKDASQDQVSHNILQKVQKKKTFVLKAT